MSSSGGFEPFRIFYVVSSLVRCGPNHQLLAIVSNLDRARFLPVLVTLSPERADSLEERFEAEGIEVIRLAGPRRLGFIALRRKLGELIGRRAPALLHSQGFRADLLVASLRMHIPHVATVRNYAYKDYVLTYGAVRGRLMAWAHLQAARYMTQVVFVSHAVRNMVGRRVPGGRVIQNGVDVKAYIPATQIEKRALREKLGLPQEVSILISTGHLSARKDPLTALSGVLGASPETCYVLLGDGELRAQLASEASKHPEVRVLGRVPNVADYLRASDYFVSASLAEGLPNAVLEALACGLPCILSDIPEHLEIGQGQACCSFFPVGSSAGLSRAIGEMLSLDQARESQAARALVMAGFQDTGMSAQYQSLYLALLI